MTKRLANLVYKIPAGVPVTTKYPDGIGGVIHEGITLLREKVFEKRDVFNSTATETEFMDWGHIIVVKNKDLKTFRYRRGKLVEIPPEWVGQVAHPQTIRKRKSKAGQGRRYKAKVQR